MNIGDKITTTVDIRIRGKYDVVVAGGGTTGVVAAIAAARASARVLLIESNGFLGGTLLKGAGPLHSFFNVYKPWDGVPKVQVVRGIPSEMIDRLMETGGSKGHLEQEKGFAYDSIATLIDRNQFKFLAQEMLLEAGAEILFETKVCDYFEQGDKHGLIIESTCGRELILADKIIDATGDAAVAAAAGLKYENRARRNNIGFPFGMANVDMKKLEAYLENQDLVTQIVHSDKEPGNDNVVRLGFELKKNPLFKEFMKENQMWGPLGYSYHKNDFAFINTAHMSGVDTIDIEENANAFITLRRQVMAMAEMLKKHIPGFKDAYISWTADTVGTRMSRIVECDYNLCKDDIIKGQRFDDEICVYGFHDMAPRVMIENGEVFGIPYRSICPLNSDHILAAGRIITKDYVAHMSTRNTVSCMAQGQGAGIAAALCARAKLKTRELDYQDLKKELIKQNVFLSKVQE